MPLFMDRHSVPDATAQDVADAHVSDLEVAGKHDVEFFSYWFDSDDGEVFCFAKAPTSEAMERVHAESHGIAAAEIIEVSESEVVRFLGRVHDPVDASEITTAFRIVVFSDLCRSTELLDRLGQTDYMVLLTEHDLIIRKALAKFGGREVKHTGDGFLVSFEDTDRALSWAIAVHAAFATRKGPDLQVRIGMSAGEPVDHNHDIFGKAVTEASRICAAADPATTLVSQVVHELGVETGHRFNAGRSITLKGFSEPTEVYGLVEDPGHGGHGDGNARRSRRRWSRRKPAAYHPENVDQDEAVPTQG